MSGLHFHSLRVRDVRNDTDDAVVVGFDVPRELAGEFGFVAGQHLTLRHTIDGQEQRRSYSICAGVDDGELRIGVRRVRGGVFSQWLHSELEPGDTIDVMPPQGSFVLRTDPAAHRNLLCVAGGAGITPILSIVKTVLAHESASRVTLVYGNRRVASTMFKEELEDLKNRYLTRLAIHLLFSREQVDSPLGSGRLDGARLGEMLRTLIDVRGIDAAYVCGPHAMNDEVEARLLAAGLAAAAIHIERFGVPSAPAGADLHAPQPGDAPQATLNIVRDGLTRTIAFHADDASILQAAGRAGLDVPYSCRSGVCGTCRARLLEGRVRMDHNFALERSDLDAGFVLTCQAHPLTPTLTVSFDER